MLERIELEETSRRTARAVILRHGWNAVAYQIVNPGLSYWFSPCREAVVGYVLCGKTRVVAGDPICAQEFLPQVMQEWERDTRNIGEHICYFGASERMQSLVQSSDCHASILIGNQPVWNPQEWNAKLTLLPSLRAQFRRAQNKGVYVREISVEDMEHQGKLTACLNNWLQTRKMPPMRFLVEPNALLHLTGRRLFIAEQGGQVVAYLLLSPVPARSGWLLEQFPRTPTAPNGTIELLVHSAVQALAAEGVTYMTMGLSPLMAQDYTQEAQRPYWFKLMVKSAVHGRGRRLYNFEGLDRFKRKFCPDYFESVYAITREKQFSPRSAYAIAQAFMKGTPLITALQILDMLLC